jgi:TonB family protein
MSSFSIVIASYLVNSVWEAVVIAAAGWLASRLLKRMGPHAEHIVWVSTLALAVLMPALPFVLWLRAFLHIPSAATEHLSVSFVAAQGREPIHASVYLLPTAIGLPFLCLYIGSLLYFALRLFWSLRCTTLLSRKSVPLTLTPQQDEIWRDCERSFSLGAVRILVSSQISGPVTLGMRAPVLLIPAGFALNCSTQDFLAALGHESAHIKRRDFLKNLFYEIGSLALAYHPAIWLIKSQIAQTRELVCDAMVTERLIKSRSYARSLLRLATMVTESSQASAVYAIGIFDANILEKRIMRMNVQKQNLGSAIKYALLIPAVLCLLSAAIGGAAMAVVIEPQSAPQAADGAKSYGQIYHVGKDVIGPVVLKSAEPKFPESGHAIRAPFNANVVVGLVVDAEGIPRDVHVVRSYKPDFDEKAVQAVQEYRFSPATRHQKPVAVAMSVEISFRKY